jgi:hypothetical protein
VEDIYKTEEWSVGARVAAFPVEPESKEIRTGCGSKIELKMKTNERLGSMVTGNC